MKIKRSSGLLLHITSLPGPNGTGTLGQEAFEFVDLLAKAGQSHWQILPFGPVSSFFGYSPYAALSTFAGNPLFISLHALQKEDWMKEDIVAKLPELDEDFADFDRVNQYLNPALQTAFDNFTEYADALHIKEFDEFCLKESDWLDDYALFTALANHFDTHDWSSWDSDIAGRAPEALQRWRDDLAVEIEREQFIQYIFYKQWQSLREYAHKKGVQLIGDIPIYVNYSSSDTWANPEIFQLHEEDGTPTVVAGVPPDYFSKTGQRWGNPLYKWFDGEALFLPTLRWWVQRFSHLLDLVDMIRVDHFRGFEAYWAIPASHPTAEHGEWLPGPGKGLFEFLQKELGELPVMAEDLGLITEEVEELRDAFNLPGMKVLQFAFDFKGQNNYLPHNYRTPNCVVYTGTHDNNTANGWFYGDETSEELKQYIMEYMGIENREAFHWSFIRLALSSVANLALIPAQDLLGFGAKLRMNVPGTDTGNWLWKLRKNRLGADILERMNTLCRLFNRCP